MESEHEEMLFLIAFQQAGMEEGTTQFGKEVTADFIELRIDGIGVMLRIDGGEIILFQLEFVFGVNLLVAAILFDGRAQAVMTIDDRLQRAAQGIDIERAVETKA